VTGHSLGEYTAACVAGVLPLEDALELVAERARLLQALPGGSMLAVSLSADEVRPFLPPGAVVAAVNAPGLCTVAGTDEAVAATERGVLQAGHAARRLATTHAFHSPMMHPAAAELARAAARMRLSAPRIPLLSNVTGTWMTEAEATDPGYWARHLCQPVRFGDGVAELLRDPDRVLLEVGPGQTLGGFARQQPLPPGRAVPLAVGSLRHAWEETADGAYLLGSLGRLWTAGVVPDWRGVFGGERRGRVPLPTYPFERSSYWVRSTSGAASLDSAPGPSNGTAASAAPAVPGVTRSPRDLLSLSGAYVAPREGTERQLQDLWERLLAVEGIGAHDNFFSLGGHSLLGTRLIARVRQEMGVELPIQALFRSPTIATMAAEITEAKLGAVDPGALEAALDELLRLPPEQVRALLDGETTSAGAGA
jgi:acyl transferase domain-containing protein